jgi:hypothetical protein
MSRVTGGEPHDVHRAEKATLFVQGEFGMGFRKMEVRWIEWVDRPYAQHPHALHVTFVPKGARSERSFVHHGVSWPFLVVAGWNVPDLTRGQFETLYETPDVVVQQGRHRAFSPAWREELDAGLQAYVSRGGRILVDGRG